MSDLDRAVRAVVRDCLGVKQGEEVLVVCNPATERLGERLREEAADAGAEAAAERGGGDDLLRRAAGADRPISLAYGRPQARYGGGGARRDPPRRHRGDA